MMVSLINLLNPENLANPYPLYEQLRSEDPVLWDEFLGRWILTGYADVLGCLRDPRMSAERVGALRSQLPEDVIKELQPMERVFESWMLFLDPPDHTRLRGLVNKAFTPRRVEAMRPHIQQIVDELLDRVQNIGRMDVIHDLAFPLPSTVIAEMLGVPPEDRDQFRRWSSDIVGISGLIIDPDRAVRAQKSVLALMDYFREIVAQRRASPRDDLISAMIAADDQGKFLSDEELLATCVLLLEAGHETTTNLIGNGLLALLRHPDQLRTLRENPSIIGTAVEELLRYDSPVQLTARIATEDMEIGDKRVSGGNMVILLLGAANRDPAQFLNPNILDLYRRDNRHLSFGQGIHYCLGAPLARIEGQIAFNTVLRRCPGLELTGEPLEWRQAVSLRGLLALPVRFEVE
ncbi:cytochrome P450 [Nitrolancea hollandica]|uniref:Biotin biosynthesis cytochrome P450 n=1 Tax=Nitrolancea hollandica Lb TaxID=1129897 RepID=I4EKT4_9BACT|nr:cytochrome P450 [Nitrolancea hollandica]CCF85296.1 Biotin biosynthesis cytochrome P450 [Nitrolancea hollandica Lb]